MARKSRKDASRTEIKEQVIALQKERKTRAGGYVRLSSDRCENDSIETQILMIKQFIKDRPDFELVDIYCDEGYSGTNFARPDFERLMRDIYSGRIDCVIVKDMSRFGRNYIEAGYYLETVLPNLGVRFISINDRFDTAREEDRYGMAIPIKNMVNAMYAADVSRKIVKSVELHQKLGDMKFRKTTYGYMLDCEGKKLIIDPFSSRYVKLIFQWCLLGYTAIQIAEKLNLMGVLIPSVYDERLSGKRSQSKAGRWSQGTVFRILRNTTYTGAKVHGKQRRRLTDGIKYEIVDPSEWIIHPDDHEPIIDQNTFDLVQEKLSETANRVRQNRIENEPFAKVFKNSFSRRVVCKDCGKVMIYTRKSKHVAPGFISAYYSCAQRRDTPCMNIIYEDYLKTVTLDQIKNLIRYFGDQKKSISALKDGRNEKSILLSNEKKLIHMKKKEADIEALILNLYKDLADGIINEKDYKELNERYLKEKETAEAEIKSINENIFRMRKWIDAFEDLGTKMMGHLNDSADSQALIDEFIERVYVSKDGSIEFVFKCNDIIENYRHLTGEQG